jgi:hypothetical protein
MDDILLQLAEKDVPPVPEEFDVRVHERLNSTLLLIQILELTWSMLPRAMFAMLRSVMHLMLFTIFGQHVADEDGHPPTR